MVNVFGCLWTTRGQRYRKRERALNAVVCAICGWSLGCGNARILVRNEIFVIGLQIHAVSLIAVLSEIDTIKLGRGREFDLMPTATALPSTVIVPITEEFMPIASVLY